VILAACVSIAASMALASPVEPALDVEDAERLLMDAEHFEVGPLGWGAHSRRPRAFLTVIEAADGRGRFARLVREGEPAAQLYGLCGLFFLDPSAFDLELARLQSSREWVGVRMFDRIDMMTFSDWLFIEPKAARLPHRYQPELFTVETVMDFAGGGRCYLLRGIAERRL